MATTSPDLWTTQNNHGMQTAATAAGVGVGLLLIVFSHAAGTSLSARSALVLGVLVLAVAVAAILFGGKQVITVDAKRRRIVLKRSNRLRTRETIVRFADVLETRLAELGDQEGGSISYYVAVKIRTGKEVALFMGFFDGSHNRAAMEARRLRLEGYLQAAR